MADELGPQAYDAFMSYSHAMDGELAPALQRALHRFARPWNRLRALRIFRDEASLPASPALWNAIERGLSSARYFVVLASPAAAGSPWVQREVTWWLANRSPETILLVLTEGDLVWDEQAGDFDWSRSTAVPPALGGTFGAEPRHVDLRWARAADDVSLRNPLFLARVADLAAALHGRDKDSLIGEDVRQHRRTRLLARGAVATLTALLVLAGVFGFIAAEQRDQAVAGRAAAQAQARLATSRQLAAEARVELPASPQRALLLGVQAMHAAPTAEARSALLAGLQNRTGSTRTLVADNPSRQNRVESLAFSADGTRLVSGLGNGGVLVWDVTENERVATFDLKAVGDVLGVAISPDKSTVAAAGNDGTLVYLDMRTQRESARLPLPASVSAFSPDGTRAALTRDKTLQLVDVWARRLLGKPVSLPKDIGDVAFSTDNRLLALDLTDRVVVWDVAGRSTLRSLQPSPGTLDTVLDRFLTFSRDGEALATMAPYGSVQLWDARRGRPLGEPYVGDRVEHVAFSPDGTSFVSTGGSKVSLWDVQGKTFRDVLTSQHGSINTVAYSPDGKTVAVGTAGAATVLLEIRANLPLGSALARENGFSSVSYLRDGRLLAVAGNRRVQLWDPEQRRIIATLFGGDSGFNDVQFSADGKLIAAAGIDGRVRLWDVASRRLVDPAPEGQSDYEMTTVAFTPDGRLLAAGGLDGTVRLWDLASMRLLHAPLTLPQPAGTVCELCSIHAITITADSKTMAVGSEDHGIALWDLDPPRIRNHLAGHTGPVTSLSLTADSRYLASGSADHTIAIWDLQTGQRSGAPLKTSRSQVAAVAISANGETLAVTGYDNTVVLWDTARRVPLGEPLYQDGAKAVAFSPDGTTLASTGCCLMTGETRESAWARAEMGAAVHP